MLRDSSGYIPTADEAADMSKDICGGRGQCLGGWNLDPDYKIIKDRDDMVIKAYFEKKD